MLFSNAIKSNSNNKNRQRRQKKWGIDNMLMLSTCQTKTENSTHTQRRNGKRFAGKPVFIFLYVSAPQRIFTSFVSNQLRAWLWNFFKKIGVQRKYPVSILRKKRHPHGLCVTWTGIGIDTVLEIPSRHCVCVCSIYSLRLRIKWNRVKAKSDEDLVEWERIKMRAPLLLLLLFPLLG